MIICAFDDRASDLIGLKLLVASLHRFAPGLPLFLACPAADADFERWLKRYPHVTFSRAAQWAGQGWDVKPLLLKHLLQQGHDEVMWVDSDIIVTGKFLDALPADGSMVVTEEPGLSAYGVTQRVTGWGLAQGRRIPAINSCVVRVRTEHTPLLNAWLELLGHPDYQQSRSLPFEQRMPHVLGDQDVLVALLASTRFAQLDLHFLEAGRDILQSRGAAAYPPRLRLRHLWTGMPPLIHSQGHKPWRPPFEPGVGGWLLRLHLETAPYAHFARDYRAEAAPFPSSLEIRSLAARAAVGLAFGQPALCGWSLSAAAGLVAQMEQLSQWVGRQMARLRKRPGRLKAPAALQVRS